MENFIISVIVPVYNVEQYLEKCVQSILEQSYGNLQIILVDDGSSDQSGQICDELSSRDQRIQVIHQKNQGVATARKIGIEYASGEYCCFVDADDYISNDMIESLYRKMGDCDLVSSGCHCQRENGEWYERVDNYPERIYDGQKDLNYILSNLIIFKSQFEDGFLPFLINKMYKTNILKQAVQDVNLKLFYAEDRDLLFRYVLKCHKICVLHQSYYYYCFRKESAVNTKNPNFLSNLNELYLSLAKAFQHHPMEYALMYQLQMFISSRAYNVSYWMGFVPEAQSIRFILPYLGDKESKRVILYGAGRVGRDFNCQIHKRADFQLVLWVDQSWQSFREKGFAVESPAKISEVEYDQIILAVKDKSVAEDIKNELREHGIPKEKIVWEQPIIFSY